MDIKNILNNWKVWIIVTIIIIILAIFYILNNFYTKNVNVDNIKQYELGDIISLDEKNETLLRNKTIEYIKDNLKAPSTARFEEDFKYSCDEENIIKIAGNFDSQNSYGAMLRGSFFCEYFAVDSIVDTLVYLEIDGKEILDIKDMYIKEYKKQKKLDNIKSSGKELNQEKLEYIMNEFNNDKINDVGKITNVVFNKNESTIDVQIVAKSSISNDISKNYWIDFNICSIMDYIKDFNIDSIVKIKLIDKNKTIEVIFDDDFVKNKWKENHQINLVKELFGENYKEMF